MQEKVHGTPPTIKIFEGKPPPSSWVDQNIVKYYQNESQTAFLKDVIAYVQILQSENLKESRPRVVVALKESFAPFPEQGSASDIANTNTFNATQGYVKLEMEFLEKLIATLKLANPGLSDQLDNLLNQLKQTSQSFPKLSSSQMQSLNSLWEEILKMADRSPKGAQRAFWNTQLRMLQALMTNNNSNMKDFKAEAEELQARNHMLTNLEKLLHNVNQSLKSHPPDSKTFLEMIENMQNLANQYNQLNPQQQESLLNYFQHLSQFTSSKGSKLTEVGADALVHSKISNFIKANPQATPKEVAEHLQTFLKQSNLQSSPLPFMKNLGDAIEDVLNKPGFPSSSGFSGHLFTSGDRQEVRPNEAMLGALLATFSPNPTSLQNMDQAAKAVTKTTAIEKEDNQTKAEGYQTTVQQLKTTQQNLGKAAAGAVTKSLGAGEHLYGAGQPAVGGDTQSLPNQFAHAIINHFMPSQEAALRELAMFLFLNNMGAQFGNQLLDKMLGFGEAADNYDFNNFLHSAGDGNFSGSVSKAKAQLSHEKNQCSRDINQVNSALNKINSQLAQIQQDINSGKYHGKALKLLKDMQDKLTGFKQELQVNLSQLNDLKDLLSKITIGPPTLGPPGKGGDPSKEFSVNGPPGWQSALGKHEGYVINGNPDNAKLKPPLPVGGLINIQANVQAFQQGYADQSQNQQMQLQMQMTEIQQEWTVVSTALQLLNQMYMTVSQAIYK